MFTFIRHRNCSSEVHQFPGTAIIKNWKERIMIQSFLTLPDKLFFQKHCLKLLITLERANLLKYWSCCPITKCPLLIHSVGSVFKWVKKRSFELLGKMNVSAPVPVNITSGSPTNMIIKLLKNHYQTDTILNVNLISLNFRLLRCSSLLNVTLNPNVVSKHSIKKKKSFQSNIVIFWY